MLPPDRFKLATNPYFIGSSPLVKSPLVNKNYLPLLRALEAASVGGLFFGCNADSPSERLVYGSAATNSTPSLAELATIHSTVYSARVPVGEGLCSIDIYRNAA